MFIFLSILLAIKNRGMCFFLFNEVDQTRCKSLHVQGGEAMRVDVGREAGLHMLTMGGP